MTSATTILVLLSIFVVPVLYILIEERRGGNE